MSSCTPIPDVETLGGFSTLAANTARGHVRAAKYLLEGGFWGQAHSIAVIGFEELGKAWLSLVAMLSPDELRNEFPFGALGDHRWKLQAARSVVALLSFLRGGEGLPPSITEGMSALGALAREDNWAKQRGFYTDYADGVLSSPADITEEQARGMVAVVEDVLDNAGPLVDLMTAMSMRDNVPPEMVSFFQQASDALQAGEDAIAVFVQDEHQKMESMAGVIKDNPEWMRGILGIARQLGEI